MFDGSSIFDTIQITLYEFKQISATTDNIFQKMPSELLSDTAKEQYPMKNARKVDAHLSELQQILAYQFQEEELLMQALTHKSFAHEHQILDNERLEFLGDAILQFAVSDYLMMLYPELSEGMLSKFRAVLVSEKGLSTLAQKIKMGSYLFIGKGEEITGGREKKSILSDALEAVIAAIYLDSKADGGVEPVTQIIRNLFKNEIVNAEKSYTSVDHKTDLQEFIQKRKLGVLKYTIIKETGPDHDKEFVTAIMIGEKEYSAGSGKSKKISEQNAAIKTLSQLKQEYGD